jgi:hypothetical protein
LLPPLQPGWPDWANFRLLGPCFLWAGFFNCRYSQNVWATFFQGLKLYVNFDYKWVGPHFGRSFGKRAWSPWPQHRASALWHPRRVAPHPIRNLLRSGYDSCVLIRPNHLSSHIRVARAYSFVPKSPIWVCLEGLEMENVGIFTAIWYILQSFGTLCLHLIYFVNLYTLWSLTWCIVFSILVGYTKKNLTSVKCICLPDAANTGSVIR